MGRLRQPQEAWLRQPQEAWLRRPPEAWLRRPQEARLRRPQEAWLRRPQEAWLWQQEARLQRQEARLRRQEARLRRQEVWQAIIRRRCMEVWQWGSKWIKSGNDCGPLEYVALCLEAVADAEAVRSWMDEGRGNLTLCMYIKTN